MWIDTPVFLSRMKGANHGEQGTEGQEQGKEKEEEGEAEGQR
jgi:hypothetical protein